MLSPEENVDESILPVAAPVPDHSLPPPPVINLDQLFPTAPRSLSAEQFRHAARSAVGNGAAMASVFLAAFYGNDAAERVQLLDTLGILTDLVPCFEAARRVFQDERWYGNRSVYEQSFRKLVEIDRMLEATETVLDPRQRAILRMAVFFSDLGKAIVSAVPVEKDGFRTIHFDGQGKASEKLVNSAFERVDALVTEPLHHDLTFTAAERQWVARMVLRSSVAAHFAHGSDPVKDDVVARHARQLMTDRMFDELIDPESVVTAYMMLERCRVRAQDVEARALDDPRLQPTVELWHAEQCVLAFIEQRFQRVGVAKLRELRDQHLNPPFLTAADWTILGIDEESRSAVSRELRARQVAGTVTTRYQALKIACEECGFRIDRDALDDLAKNERPELPVPRRGFTGSFEFKVKAEPLIEIRPDDDPGTLSERLATGRFPRVVAWMEKHNFDLSGLKALLVERGFGNLILLEQFLGKHPTDPRDVYRYHCHRSSNVIVCAAWENGKTRATRFTGGFQSYAPGRGTGDLHIMERRIREIAAALSDGDEASPEESLACFLEGLHKIAGQTAFEIPSGINPLERRLIPGVIDLDRRFFATLVVDVSTRPWSTVTAFFHKTPTEFRNDLKSNLRSYHAARAKLPARARKALPQIDELVVQINDLFADLNPHLAKGGVPGDLCLKPLIPSKFDLLRNISGVKANPTQIGPARPEA